MPGLRFVRKSKVLQFIMESLAAEKKELPGIRKKYSYYIHNIFKNSCNFSMRRVLCLYTFYSAKE